MKISSAFPSKYLRAADLDGRQATVEISHIEMEDVATGEEPKPVLYFVGKGKGVVMNKTNANAISNAYGDDTDDWIGQQIVLFSAHVDFQGRSVEAIRVKVPPRKPPARQNAAPPPVPMNGGNPNGPVPAYMQNEAPPIGDDDIPF